MGERAVAPPVSDRPRIVGASAVLGLLATAAFLFAPVVHGARATHEWASAPRVVESLEVVRQRGRLDCGPALLATLASWSGNHVSLDSVLALVRVAPTGTSLAEFARVAAGLGVPGVWYHVPQSRLDDLATPFVAHLDAGAGLGHFVAVVALSGGFAVVADPARGAWVGGTDRLLAGYSGRAFLLDERLEPGWNRL
ncbi:MAG TPA: cysteine peptidase family C39 domain-containing protein [Trueperaceae bacterium]